MLMKNIYLLLVVLSGAMVCYGQELPQTGAPILSEVSGMEKSAAKVSAVASYELPAGLRCLGTINAETGAVCNFLSFNRTMNGQHFLWAPRQMDVTYINNTEGATSYLWSVPGGNATGQTTENCTVQYYESGSYAFPTLFVTEAGGSSDYTAEGALKVGGKAEICCADTREWGVTYQTAYYPLNAGGGATAGWLGGTNSAGMTGYGNLFMTSQKNAHMTGVNVYLPFKPTKWAADSRLLLQVWYPVADEESGTLDLTGLPIEVVYLDMSEIREAEEDELAIRNAAVAEFRFETPLQIWDKPLFFVTVEGFGTDPEAEDFCMLTEIIGKEMTEVELTNLMAHNSFVRYGGTDYQMPINYFGTMPGASFMICPIIDNLEDSGVESVTSSPTVLRTEGKRLTICNAQATDVRVIDLCGMTVAQTTLDGEVTVEVGRAGVYIVQLLRDGMQVDVKKVMMR